MKKLALKLEDLAVESFETAPDSPSRGTVMAHGTSAYQFICECSNAVGSCDYTCGDTCGNSCGGGCGTGFCTEQQTCATGNQFVCECYG
jgi:hypothetical protein